MVRDSAQAIASVAAPQVLLPSLQLTREASKRRLSAGPAGVDFTVFTNTTSGITADGAGTPF